jgi:ketosteroid isomerase-like protein
VGFVKRSLVVICALLTLLANVNCAHADAKGKEVEEFINEYLRLWNAGDAAAITERIYRFDSPNPLGTQQGLQAEFNRLKADGYHHSTVAGNSACLINPSFALVELRYSRIKTDGTPMAPANRATLYFVRKTADGWRISQLVPMNVTAKLNCSSLVE